MFGIQTFFISKSITYLIRIFIYYNLDSQILDGQVFLAFFLGLNIIDWTSLIPVSYTHLTLPTNPEV